MTVASYQEIYPSSPLIRFDEQVRPSARGLLSLEYFEADPDVMPTRAFDQHHILINLKDQPQRVENWRGGEHRDFTFRQNELVVTPAGLSSGWQWHERSKCIVITLQPNKLEAFTHLELGLVLSDQQLRNEPQIADPELSASAIMLLDALRLDGAGSDVMFESLARVFLIKLLTKYGDTKSNSLIYSDSFSARHHKLVLDFIAGHYEEPIQVQDIASEIGLSPSHFSRSLKAVIGETPYQFLMRYRVERAAEKLNKTDDPLITIALSCGFADQPHLTRIFKKYQSMTPKAWRRTHRKNHKFSVSETR